ncbi:YncE family protein [Actinomadura gamaensis]|uniref:YncE family protein n=1 Tax=Actinomadura gamaensis TaxID=1763541 RepID=A0ABV9U6P7_9ACTN
MRSSTCAGVRTDASIVVRTGVLVGSVAVLAAFAETPARAAAPNPVPTSAPQAAVAFRAEDARLADPGALARGIAHPDVWWTLDARRQRLFALGDDGRTKASFTVPGTRGWDTLAVVKGDGGAGTIFLADLNGTGAKHDTLTLYKVPEPARLADAALTAKTYQVTYPDGAHEAGTVLGDPSEQRLYVVTRTANAASVYALPAALGSHVGNRLTRVRRLPFGVRGGAFAPDGRVVLRGGGDLRVLAGIRDKVTQVLRTGAKGDAIAVAPDGRRVLIAESGSRPRVLALPLADAPSPQTESAGPVPGRAATDPAPRTEDYRAPKESLPGGVLGTGSVAGLVLLGAVGGGLYLRGRRRVRH